jgi:hypothetical protein
VIIESGEGVDRGCRRAPRQAKEKMLPTPPFVAIVASLLSHNGIVRRRRMNDRERAQNSSLGSLLSIVYSAVQMRGERDDNIDIHRFPEARVGSPVGR